MGKVGTTMSKIETHRLACPQCGQQQDVAIWDSLNVTLEPVLRKKLFSGEINIFKCTSCQYEAFISHSLLYHDMQREYCVQYYPPEVLKKDEFLTIFTKDGKLDLQGIFGRHYLNEPHIVFNINEMILYIEFRDRIFALNKQNNS
jgi:hypothetical protein